MWLTSIRSRVALLSALFAVLLVGGVTVTTYFFVADGMSRAADDAASRLALAGRRMVEGAVEDALAEADRRGLSDVETEAYVARTLMGSPPSSVAVGLAEEVDFALFVWPVWGDAPIVAWTTAAEADEGAESSELLSEAMDTGQVLSATVGRRPLVAGLLSSADLGRRVTYLPVEVPGVKKAVVRVTYIATREEETLDNTRLPMTVVAAVSFVLALLISDRTTHWTLSLVDSLRRTADSIDVGQLDIQLPVDGSNEVSELARSLNRLIDNLRRRNEAQARFIADASHELATPVAGIRGYVNILRAWGAEDPALREEAVSAIDRESRRMARLCSDLLSVIRSEEIVEYRQIRYDINAVSREVLANAATRYIDKQLEFAGPDESPLWLYGDPDRVEEALGILVDNACKYTPASGVISVTTRRHRDHIVIEVADTGVGIAAEDLPNVFERFYRSDSSRSKATGGFGLGLAIARHIVDSSGGEIEVESTVGRGTTFSISLPRQRVRIS